MANEEHLSILRQGVETWNRWRKENPKVQVDLREADLKQADLYGANLTGANLTEADLYRAHLYGARFTGATLIEVDLIEAILPEAYLFGANLTGATLTRASLIRAKLTGARLTRADLTGANLYRAHLIKADLTGANLTEANLIEAILREANLTRASLIRAKLTGARLTRADLTGANLYRADLTGANLNGAKLTEASLIGADLSGANLGATSFGDTKLTETTGLDACNHNAPSNLDHRTLAKNPHLPIEFLRGCGLTDWEIESAKLHRPNLSNAQINDIIYRIFDLRATQAIQINPLFISYSHADGAFIDHLEKYLNAKGIRFWRDIHDATAGRLERQVDRAIRHNPTMLLVLSEHSTKSDWVEHEVRVARKLEIETGRDVLCPVSLDDSWKTCRWPARLREQIEEYLILDFSAWEDESTFEAQFDKLLRGLRIFYEEERTE